MNKFEVSVEGITIKAILSHLSRSDINAKIIDPKELKGITVCGGHIPYFAMGESSRWYLIDDRIAPRGIEIIEYEMKEAYHRCSFFNKNLNEIRLKLKQIQIASYISFMHEDFLADENFKEQKRLCKRRMKQGEFDSREYQKKLKVLRKRNDKYYSLKLGIEDGLRKYLDETYGMFLSVCNLRIYMKKYLLEIENF